ncbi:MAG: UDP-3-O-(3-hydroxymyristoyl)glucosamine N-acyltransferase [Candidatus Hydrogenedentota bacterium]|nr:MAG: UDP-3-O-(3-hydroxymyristoyl)glucosamine N-acyltransferase [Candidatus Hydrogenedentota bacterium]
MNRERRSLAELAEFVGGRIVGDPETIITGVSAIENARRGDITFAVEEKYLQNAAATEASCIIVPPHITESELPLLQVENPRFAFARIASLYAPQRRFEPGIHTTAVIHETAILGREIAVGANVVIGENARIGDCSVLFPGVIVGRDVSIGDHTHIHSNVSLEDGVTIGSHCVIHAGTVIGSDGFGFVEDKGKHYKIPQIGTVVVEDNVEIGANCTIDRAASGQTVIGSGTKIDNLVHIAHNVVIGSDCLIVAQVGISGSVRVGDHVVFAGQAGVAGHLTIGPGTVVAAKSGVTKSLPGHMHVSGFPAKPHNEEKKIVVSLPRLPELVRKVGQLTTAVQRLARRIDKLEGGPM